MKSASSHSHCAHTVVSPCQMTETTQVTVSYGICLLPLAGVATDDTAKQTLESRIVSLSSISPEPKFQIVGAACDRSQPPGFFQ